ncbi:hypothetical protein ES703_110391 [subsurface metagenome]
MKVFRGSQGISESIQAVEGAMLSDAGVYIGSRHAHFTMKQSYKEHLDWLNYLAACFENLGISSTVRPYEQDGCRDGLCYILQSRVHPWLTGQRWRWYPNGKKIVPDDLHLTPITIANWIMGDGSVRFGWTTAQVAVINPCIVLSTQGFDLNNVEKLREKLQRVGVRDTCHYKTNNKSSGVAILVKREGTSKIRSAIGEYVAPSFQYKMRGPIIIRPNIRPYTIGGSHDN